MERVVNAAFPHRTHMEKDDPLWDLLGKAPTPPPSPWLEGKTMARVRREMRAEEANDAPRWKVWVLRLLFAGGCTAAALVAVLFLFSSQIKPGVDTGLALDVAPVEATAVVPAAAVTTFSEGDIQEAFTLLADRGGDVDTLLDSSLDATDHGVY